MSKPSFQPGVYKHYRGGLYRALFLACDHETQELVVVYVPLQPHDPSQPQIRPLATPGKDSWTDKVKGKLRELPDGPDGIARYDVPRVPRFKRVGE